MSARNVKWAAMLFFLTALISCSQQEDICNDVTNGKEIITTVSLGIPKVFNTRTAPDVYETGTTENYFGTSGTHSVGNVDLGVHPLTFTVGIYVKKNVDGKEEYIKVDKQWKENVTTGPEAEFNFRLIEGEKYQIVAYADYSGKHKENLDAIPFSTKLNDELSDAFFVNEEFTASEHVATVLKRPFGKLRLIAHDFNTFAAGEVFKIQNIKVKYHNQHVMSSTEDATMLANNYFNAITTDFFYKKDEPTTGGEGTGSGSDGTENGNKGTGNDEEETTPDYIEKEAAPVIYEQEYDENKNAEAPAVFTMYLPANMGTPIENDPYADENSPTPVPQSWLYPFDVEVTYINQDRETKKIQRSFDFDIPVKRNWLTTVDAEYFWTKNSSITVTVDPRFDDEINVEPPKTVTVKDFLGLKNAIKAIEDSPSKEGKIILENDIKVNYKAGITIGYEDKTNTKEGIKIYLDLNGKRIYTPDIGDNNKELLKYSLGLFEIYGPNSLIIEDNSEEADGTIDIQMAEHKRTIICWRYGGNLTINAGRFICNGHIENIYMEDKKEYVASVEDGGKGLNHSTLTINGGWFENKKGLDWDKDGRFQYGETLINIYNGPGEGSPNRHPDDKGYGHVHLNGGSYVDFNPANGDNICNNKTNDWVDDKHTVLTETVNGHTVYTVIPNETPGYQ